MGLYVYALGGVWDWELDLDALDEREGCCTTRHCEDSDAFSCFVERVSAS